MTRIALAQLVSGPDPARNLDLVAEQTAAAAAAGASLVIFPEATMRCFGRSLAEVAEPLDGPWATRVREIAREAGITVAAGMFTPTGDGRVTNTLLITGPDVDARYDKVHLFDAFGFTESRTVAPGQDLVVVELAGLRIGCAICYDLRFPELFTRLADRGAQLIMVPASWGAGPGKLDQWRLLVRARALDSTTFVAACGQADPSTLGIETVGSAPTGVGGSLVVGPNGAVIAEAGIAPELLVADLDPDTIGPIRDQLPVLANRRLG
ncbi:carbon-nitrogen hydrolase family protein [Microlunatus parietis]|uniref:Putative amidohydrolase n=1 Tax=Microlunatus parietis TaxID=682979 RepID=A0A7Y9IE33_9ACTN|nr:carbon-nitrogen hydrolase family protein [Microlunatus parietis]NYE75236.1 putative amidohydrolase [Microlunatus parietis]